MTKTPKLGAAPSARSGRTGSFVLAGLALVVALPMLALSVGTDASGASTSVVFDLGAAQVDITPPLRTAATDAAEFEPVCGLNEAQLDLLWPGPRHFAFEDPYIDLLHTGDWAPGDPYCDADLSHRYQAPYIGGGSGDNRWPESADDPADGPMPTNTSTGKPDAPDPIEAQAVVFEQGTTRIAVVTVDSIGLFDSTMDEIRAAVLGQDSDLDPGDIFISSTHDESAPDPIGLWGPDLSGIETEVATPTALSSGVDEDYMRYLVDRVADAIVEADTPLGANGPLGPATDGLQPARLKLVDASLPSNIQACWSSYPFVDAELMPVMQGVNASSGHVIFTLVNGQTHDETLGFSGNPAYTARLSGDWAGRMRAALESEYPGSIGVEMSGLVGSVETPTVYEPESTQVERVPEAFISVKGNPNGCSTVYPTPAGATPVTDAESFLSAYGDSMADAAVAALQRDTTTVVPTTLSGQSQSVCVQLENTLFIAAFALDLFPDRPAYADPDCSVGASLGGAITVDAGATLLGLDPTSLTLGTETTPAVTYPSAPVYLRSEVGVVNIGPAQIAYSPGEVFPFTEIGGPVDEAQMPFPTDCFLPNLSPSKLNIGAAGNFACGSALPMTPDIAADMTGAFKFSAGLGEDMMGYLFPPGNFVGNAAEAVEAPWALYEDTNASGNDRFGYGHADDAESVGPHAALAVTDALAKLLAQDPGPRPTVRPGLFVDRFGDLCDSPFPLHPSPTTTSWVTCPHAFTGAIGVEVVEPDGTRKVLRIGEGGVSGWATYDSTPDPGTAGTDYRYSVSTRGVIVDGQVVLIDVFTGAADLGLPSIQQ